MQICNYLRLGGKGMFQCFYPDYEADNAYGIAYEELYEAGYRGIIFDIDNTLDRKSVV